MDAVVAIYTTQDSPRFRWATKVLLSKAMGVSYVVYNEAQAFEQAEGFKINYSAAPMEGVFQILPHKLIWEQDIVEQELYAGQWEGIPTVCQRQVGDLP